MTNVNEYFREGEGTPVKEGRFVTLSDIQEYDFVEGAIFQPLMGDNILVNYIRVGKNSPKVLHSHEEEQLFMVIEGEIDFTVGDETRKLRKGDFAIIPPWVRHGASTGDNTAVGIDIFSPPRRELKELIEEAEKGQSG